MIKTVLIGGLAVTILTFFLNGGGSRLRGGSSSTGPSARYGPPYLPPGVPQGPNRTTSSEPHFRIILSSNQNRNKSRISPESVLSGSLNNKTSSNSSVSFFLTPPTLRTTVSGDEMTTEVSQQKNGSSLSSSSLMASSLEQMLKDSLTQDDVAGQGINPQGTTESSSVSNDSTTVSYIQLRTESMQTAGVSSTSPVSPESVTSSPTTAGTLIASEEYTEKPESSISTASTGFREKITSTTVVFEDYSRGETSGAKQDLKSESTTARLPKDAAMDGSISYIPVSSSQPGRSTESLTEQDYSYHVVSSEEAKNAGEGESSGYLPPSRPAMSLRLPSSQYGSPQSTSNGGIGSYAGSPGRIPALYLPPRV